MGSIISQEQNGFNQSQSIIKNTQKNEQSWKILQKSQHRQILKSSKTSLIVQRYWFEMQNYQDFQQQNKLFEWRNQNPNSEFMVNILSINKTQSLQSSSTVQCQGLGFCPSGRLSSKIYVVTQRILKIGQINELINFQLEIENSNRKTQNAGSYATNQNNEKKQKKKNVKYLPFLMFRPTQIEKKQIIKDWIRGIEVLCYKLGYFTISYDHLGINLHKRGIVWISQNYALNHLENKNKVQVSTAQQKFRYQKETIQKILIFTENIPLFKNIINQCKNKKIQRFDDFSNFLDGMIAQERRSHPHQFQNRNYQPLSKKNNNISLCVENHSFMIPNQNFNASHNNSSFFQFDHRNILKRINSNQKNFPKLVLQDSQRNSKNILINSKNSSRLNLSIERQIKRSNTGQKLSQKNSPQSNQQINFINSNHKHCGKDTAPTNQLGHSSSLQSVSNQIMMNNRMNQQIKMTKQDKSLFKSHNNNDRKNNVVVVRKQNGLLQKPVSSPSKKVYFHQTNKNCTSSEPYISRTQSYNNNSSLIENNNGHNNFNGKNNFYFNSPKHYENNQTFNLNAQQKYRHQHNYSLDQHNIVGPYRKDKFYLNLKKQKITLIDSMVMVKQQSEEIEEDLYNLSNTNVIMQQSIILMGRQDPILKNY